MSWMCCRAYEVCLLARIRVLVRAQRMALRPKRFRVGTVAFGVSGWADSDGHWARQKLDTSDATQKRNRD
jgi:hypothetical protein